MTLQQNIDAQLRVIEDIHLNGISEDKLEALHTLGEQEKIFLTYNLSV